MKWYFVLINSLFIIIPKVSRPYNMCITNRVPWKPWKKCRQWLTKNNGRQRLKATNCNKLFAPKIFLKKKMKKILMLYRCNKQQLRFWNLNFHSQDWKITCRGRCPLGLVGGWFSDEYLLVLEILSISSILMLTKLLKTSSMAIYLIQMSIFNVQFCRN